jgi:hypothetical protein
VGARGCSRLYGLWGLLPRFLLDGAEAARDNPPTYTQSMGGVL